MWKRKRQHTVLQIFLRRRKPGNLELLEETDKKMALHNQLFGDIQINPLLNSLIQPGRRAKTYQRCE